MKDSKNIPVINDQFDMNVFLHIVKRTKWLILLISVVIGLITAIYLRYAQREYESSAIIQITNENSSTKILGVENAYDEDQLVQIIELMKSKQFMARTLEQLPLKKSFYNKGVFLSEELYKHEPIDLEYKITDNKVYGKRFFFNYINQKKYVIKLKEGDKEKEFSGVFKKWIKIDGTQMSVAEG
jgi:hypothetical protein